MSTAALMNLWNFIQGMSLSDRNKQWLADRLIESKSTAKKDSVNLAQKICTEDEYQQLMAEGFLDNPQPQFGPFSDEEIVQRIKEVEEEEYLSAEESSAWMERLAAI